MILPSSSQGQIGSSDFHPGLLRFKEVFGIKLQVTFDVIATSPPVSQGNKRQIGRQSCGLSKVTLVSIHFLNFGLHKYCTYFGTYYDRNLYFDV